MLELLPEGSFSFSLLIIASLVERAGNARVDLMVELAPADAAEAARRAARAARFAKEFKERENLLPNKPQPAPTSQALPPSGENGGDVPAGKGRQGRGGKDTESEIKVPIRSLI